MTDRWLSATRLASHSSVELVIIATWRSREQAYVSLWLAWNLSGGATKKIARYFSNLFCIRSLPSGAAGGPMYLHSPHIARYGSADWAPMGHPGTSPIHGGLTPQSTGVKGSASRAVSDTTGHPQRLCVHSSMSQIILGPQQCWGE